MFLYSANSTQAQFSISPLIPKLAIDGDDRKHYCCQKCLLHTLAEWLTKNTKKEVTNVSGV